MKRLLLPLLGLFLWGFTPIASTPDISVSGSATMDVQLPATANWVFLQNDCSSDLYFRFTTRNIVGSETALGMGDGYPLRLAQDEDFQAPLVVTTIGASNSSTSACTFTLVLGR